MEFFPSKRLEHVERLSRFILKPCEPLEETAIATLRLEIKIKSMLWKLPETIEEIRNKAKIDKYIMEKKKQINDQQYKKIDGEKIFSIYDGILMYGQRLVIPGVWKRKKMNNKRLPYQSSWYSEDESFDEKLCFLDREIEENVKSCRGCAIAAKARPPVKFTLWPKTDRPWSRLHINFAGLMKGQYHLIEVDIFSKWPQIMKCKNPTCRGTIRFLHELFSRFGLPHTIPSDNGTIEGKRAQRFLWSLFDWTHNYCTILPTI